MVTQGLTIDVVIKAGSFQRSISFDANPGVTALVGPSGCGKTTTLNTIAGLIKPQKGRVTFNGEIWFDSDAHIDVSPQQRRPGYVFQNTALFPHLSISQNILFGVGPADDSLKQSRLQKLVMALDLTDLLKHKTSQLSGGQSQRVALARALAPEPKLLLLDEPLNALDRKSREEIAGKLRRLQIEQELTIIYVTHFLEESQPLADYVVELSPV